MPDQPHQPLRPVRTIALTTGAMVFFAANSVLCRLALRENEIDAGSFTAIRVLSGAAVLALLVSVRGTSRAAFWTHSSWRAALSLFGYAAAFSFAYLSLDAGVGALILFGTVQVTMIGVGIMRGERPGTREWAGLILAFGGLVYLVSPGATAPSLFGAVLMTISGVGWGCYSLAARGVASPTAATAGNFMRATPMAAAVVLVVLVFDTPHASGRGIALAATSGAITSGLGYAIWYTAMRGLTTSRAAIVQLTVPVIAAGAGVALLDEQMTARLAIASFVILGGVALALSRIRPVRSPEAGAGE